MTKEQKTASLEAITEQLQGVNTVYLTNYAGLTVEKANDLRNRFRDAGVDFKVYKNTLVKLAMKNIGSYDEALYEYLNGPTGFAFSNDPSAPARVIKKFLDDLDSEIPEFKAATVEGSVFHSDQLDALAALKSKDELISDIIGLLLAPITNVVGALQAPGSTLAGAVKEIAEKAEA